MLNDLQADVTSVSDTSSPQDSLSPLDDHTKDEFRGRDRIRRGACEREILPASSELLCVRDGKQQEARRSQTQQEHHLIFPDPKATHEAVTTPISTKACSLRFSLLDRGHRPTDLKLTRTNGFTNIPLHELKQQISSRGTATCATITQVSQRRQKDLGRPPIEMGNKPSSVSGSPGPGDTGSMRSVVRKPVRVLRKSSTMLFKRMDSKSPLPAVVTTAAIQAHQQASPTTFDGSHDEEQESPVDPFMDGNPPSKSPDVVPVLSPLKDIVTNNDALEPLSASTTIQDLRGDSRRGSRVENQGAFIEDISPEPEEEEDAQGRNPSPTAPPPPPHCGLALSPSIPAPSPLPEDSPHKYGLKDRMDTPEVPDPEDINVDKTRRRSTGLDIFNQAKSLQSASSFLNGLSTSRRRAESLQRSTDFNGWTNASCDTTRPSSRLLSRPSSTRPTSAIPSNTYASERRRGHNFKPSGFAYSRPLGIAQMKCYRSHICMLPSRNKAAPVECSVCHIDDDTDHFSCSWCAIRMCRFCRTDFAERGLNALKERIKHAELGGSSPNSSTDSLGGMGRGRRQFG